MSEQTDTTAPRHQLTSPNASASDTDKGWAVSEKK